MTSFYEMRSIYECLSDEISRELFIARLNYSATGDMTYIMDIDPKYRNLSSDTEIFYSRLKNGIERTVIFGAGGNGVAIASNFNFANMECFIDNYKNIPIEPITNKPIYSLEKFIELKGGVEGYNFVVSLANRNAAIAISKQLLANGVNEKNIIMLNGDWRNNESQYFDLFYPRQDEVFVDCGCYDGGTAYRFAAWCGSLGFEHIYSFEPDPNLFERCKRTLANLDKCDIFPYGVSDEKGVVEFIANGNEDARISRNGESSEQSVKIETVKLDDILADKRVTFIKMDIEGAEYDALIGAERIIREQKPRLAICIYHDVEHFVTIPKLLLEYRPDYSFSIRQYSLLANETILYAE